MVRIAPKTRTTGLPWWNRDVGAVVGAHNAPGFGHLRALERAAIREEFPA